MTEKKRVRTNPSTKRLRWEVSVTDRVWRLLLGQDDEAKFKNARNWLKLREIDFSTHKGIYQKFLFEHRAHAQAFYSEFLRTIDLATKEPVVVEIDRAEEEVNEYRSKRGRIYDSIKRERIAIRNGGPRKSRSAKLNKRKPSWKGNPIPPVAGAEGITPRSGSDHGEVQNPGGSGEGLRERGEIDQREI